MDDWYDSFLVTAYAVSVGNFTDFDGVMGNMIQLLPKCDATTYIKQRHRTLPSGRPWVATMQDYVDLRMGKDREASPLPELWGPAMWLMIHLVAHSSPGNVHIFQRMMTALARAIPCETCKTHLSDYLRQHPIRNNNNIFQWSVDLHNAVNERLGKDVVSLEEATRLIRSVPPANSVDKRSDMEWRRVERSRSAEADRARFIAYRQALMTRCPGC